MPDFMQQYKEIEECFREQIKRDREQLKCDDIVYLQPFTIPSDQVDYVFIAMEPALTKVWLGEPPNRNNGDAAVKKGARNFMPGRIEECVLYYCATKYLGGRTFYITDMSKGAMTLDRAKTDRGSLWKEWFGLLEKELKLVAKEDATVFAIGTQVYNFLTHKKRQDTWFHKTFAGRIEYLLHYSGSAAGYRKNSIIGKESEFNDFKTKVTEKDIIDVVIPLLTKECTEWAKDSIERVKGIRITKSWKMLIFGYKMKMEACGRKIQ